mgnify:FL=1
MGLGYRKHIFILSGVVLIGLLLIWAKAYRASGKNLRIGERHLLADNKVSAITFFDRSLHWYAPFNPHFDQSAQHLWDMAVQAEREGDTQLALMAFRSICRGLNASRSFFTPKTQLIRRCRVKIEGLMNQKVDGQTERSVGKPLSEHQKHAEPNVFWSVMLSIGLFGWIGSVIGFLLFSLTDGPSPGLISRRGIGWGTAVVVFYALWIVGMVRA